MVARSRGGRIRVVNDDEIKDVVGDRCGRCYSSCGWQCECYYIIYHRRSDTVSCPIDVINLSYMAEI